MPSSSRSLESDIARRYKAMQGLRTAGIAFASAAGAVLVASGAMRCAAVRPGFALSAGALLLAGVAAAVGWGVGRARRVSLPHVLLSVDLALGTGERLSSLYELRSRDAAPALQRRIEEKLALDPPVWQRVLRPRRADILPWGVGMAALAAALVLAAGGRPPTVSPVPAVAPAATSRTPSASEADPSARFGGPPVGGVAAEPVRPEQGAVAEPLVDALAELLPTPPSRGLLGSSDGAMEEDRRGSGGRGSDDGQALSDVLSQIMSRSQDEAPQDFDLTEDERETLRDLAEGLPDSPLRRALLAILEGEPGDAMKDEIAMAQELLGELRPTDPGEDGTPSGYAVEEGNASQGTGDPRDTLPGEGDVDGRPEGPAGDDAELGTDPAAPGDEGRSAPSSGEQGGRAGRGEGNASSSPGAAGLVFTELLSEWGTSGDVWRFMTRGLPFEAPAAGESGPPGALSLKVETLRALLETRALAPELQDLVRAYFETITQGEP
ncbi:MAG: hypothetical protein PHX77_02640 [Candidatus Bipolaricaulis sp.]|nr:hypothetical protein [Candidatus Bipolaricaulis sp.]